MRVAIYGAGALGTVLGSYIAKSNEQIDLINRNKEHVDAINTNGAKITGTVDFTQNVKAILPKDMEGKYDIIILMTKQLDNENVVKMLANYLEDDGVICTAQNGLPEPLIASIIGENRTYGCAIGWGAQIEAPGVVKLTSDPSALVFALGALNNECTSDKHFKEIIRLFSLMGKVELCENHLGVRWSKLLVNGAFSGLSTVFGTDFGGVSDNKKSRRLAQGIIKEIIDSTMALGIKIEPIQGKDVVKLLNYNSKFKKWLSYHIIPIAIKKHRLIRASMLTDILNHKPCEVIAINGVVTEAGIKANVKTPINDLTVKLIKEIEEGKRTPSFNNLEAYSQFLK